MPQEVTDKELEAQRQDQLDQSLSRGSAFEILIRTKGWEYIKAWCQAKVQTLATNLLISNKAIGEFEAERQELVGIRKLLGFVENDIQVLRKHEEDKRSAKK